MARRGAELRAHILDVAKAAFLESGYERTSMDAVAARAETSKRSLYAHFPTKDVLFLAVVDRSDELFRNRLSSPEQYAAEPAEAAARYCGRFVEILSWPPVIRTCRLVITESDRLPAAAAQLYEVFFGTATERLATYLAKQYGLSAEQGDALATSMLSVVAYPAMLRALFGVEAPREPHGSGAENVAEIGAEVDMPAIRSAVDAALRGAGI
jgi:TetR/AcrR family transcriptional regulator of autoinduction and epiphytic fitness